MIVKREDERDRDKGNLFQRNIHHSFTIRKYYSIIADKEKQFSADLADKTPDYFGQIYWMTYWTVRLFVILSAAYLQGSLLLGQVAVTKQE